MILFTLWVVWILLAIALFYIGVDNDVSPFVGIGVVMGIFWVMWTVSVVINHCFSASALPMPQ